MQLKRRSIGKIFSSAQHKIHFCRMGGNCLQNVLMDAWKDRDCSVQPMMIFLSSTRSKASLEPSSSSLARTRLSLNMHNLPIYVELENSLFSLCYYHWSTDNLLGYVTIGSNPPSHQVSYRNFQNISTYIRNIKRVDSFS